MKYRDLITIFVTIFFFLSLAYTFGVDKSYWTIPIPIALFVLLVVIVYKLWIEK